MDDIHSLRKYVWEFEGHIMLYDNVYRSLLLRFRQQRERIPAQIKVPYTRKVRRLRGDDDTDDYGTNTALVFDHWWYTVRKVKIIATDPESSQCLSPLLGPKVESFELHGCSIGAHFRLSETHTHLTQIKVLNNDPLGSFRLHESNTQVEDLVLEGLNAVEFCRIVDVCRDNIQRIVWSPNGPRSVELLNDDRSTSIATLPFCPKLKSFTWDVSLYEADTEILNNLTHTLTSTETDLSRCMVLTGSYRNLLSDCTAWRRLCVGIAFQEITFQLTSQPPWRAPRDLHLFSLLQHVSSIERVTLEFSFSGTRRLMCLHLSDEFDGGVCLSSLHEVIIRVPKEVLSYMRATERFLSTRVPWKRRIIPSLKTIPLREYADNDIPFVGPHVDDMDTNIIPIV
jgi:hypothetical protein